MSCSPIDIFELAHWLHDTRPESVSSSLIRTIINRAYYAALISARDYTSSKTTGPGGHRNVIDALRPIDADAARKLDSMRLQRQKADYKLNESLTIRDALVSLVNSRAVLYASGQTIPASTPYSENFLDKSKFLEVE